MLLNQRLAPFFATKNGGLSEIYSLCPSFLSLSAAD